MSELQQAVQAEITAHTPTVPPPSFDTLRARKRGRDRRRAATVVAGVALLAAGIALVPAGFVGNSPDPDRRRPAQQAATALPSLAASPDPEFTPLMSAHGRGGTRTITFPPEPVAGAIKLTSTCLGGGVIGMQVEGSGLEANCSGEPVENVLAVPANVSSLFVYAEPGSDWQLLIQRYTHGS